MNTIVNSTNLTEEAFRQSDVLRKALTEFLQTECGMSVMYLLKERAKIKAKAEAVPPEHITNYSVAELSRLAGCQQQIDFIEQLLLPPKPKATSPVSHLGHHREDDLAKKLPVPTAAPQK